MRVIAGRYKGRRLKPPTWAGLRPTSDKLRETLFNILAPRLAGARVLDGFAGTGAIGIEALSRGAAHVTFIDADRRSIALISENLSACGIGDGVVIEQGDIGRALQRQPADVAFDIAVLDPPYEASRVAAALDAVAARLAADGVVVLEHATRIQPEIPPSLVRMRQVRSGDSTLMFLGRRI